MIAVTRQDPSMDWWYAVPSQFTPKLSQAHSVPKGEIFSIIPLFKNYGVDPEGYAKITFDFEVLRPDGSADESLKNCIGYEGKASSPLLVPSHAVLNLCFDPEDPYGTYTITITALDHVSGVTNLQSAIVQQKKFSFQTLTAEERDQLFLTYAANPDPSRALSSFLQTNRSFFNSDKEPIWSAIWFYKTIFENNDYLIPHLLDGFSTASLKRQQDIILILALMEKTDRLPRTSGDLKSFLRMMKSGRIPDPYAEITSGKQLDMLWAEFFATGNIRPIRQLVTALNLVKYQGTLDQIKTGELDSEKPEIYRAGTLEATFQSTLWSLRKNCSQTPLLYHYCVGILDSEELEKPAQSCLAMLLQSIKDETDKKQEELP